MGFFGDFAGAVLGSMVASYQEQQKYMRVYEPMTDKELFREYNDLKNRGGKEFSARRGAVRTILSQRGYFKNND